MAFRIRISRRVVRQAKSWGLSGPTFVDLFERLRDGLAERPAERMMPSTDPRGGMLYDFRLIDPDNRFCEHAFRFHVYYVSDEETLFVAWGRYRRHAI